MPPPTPSWGQMLDVGLQNISKWWMVFAPVGVQFFTLMLILITFSRKSRWIMISVFFKVSEKFPKKIQKIIKISTKTLKFPKFSALRADFFQKIIKLSKKKIGASRR